MAKAKAPVSSDDPLRELFEAYSRQEDPELVDSGSVVFNTVVANGGIPKGCWVQVAASPGVGKSTAMLHVAKTFCERGEKVFYLDHEAGVNPSQLDGIGLSKHLYHPERNPDGLFYLSRPKTFEEADRIMFKLVNEIHPAMVVIDSLAAMTPGKLMDQGVEEILPGIQARYSSAFFNKYKGPTCKLNMIVFCINQVRTTLRFIGKSTVDPAGGFAPKHFCDILLEMVVVTRLNKTIENTSGKEVVPYGSIVKLLATKNKYNPPFIPLNLAIIFGRGVSNIFSYIEFLTYKGVVTKSDKSGGYVIQFDGMDPIKKRGYAEMDKWVKENIHMVVAYIKEQGGFKLNNRDVSTDEEDD